MDSFPFETKKVKQRDGSLVSFFFLPLFFMDKGAQFRLLVSFLNKRINLIESPIRMVGRGAVPLTFACLL